MRKWTVVMCLATVAIALTACAIRYQAGVNNGYSEISLAPDSYVVTFKSNVFTTEDVTMSYAFRRAAELTLIYKWRR